MRWVVLVALCAVRAAQGAVEYDASPPKRVAISVYDAGFALISELRTVTLARGENLVRFGQLPARLDPGTVHFSVMAGEAGWSVLEQQFRYDLLDITTLLDRFSGRAVEVVGSQGSRKGVLLRELRDEAGGRGPQVVLRADDGSLAVFPDLEGVEAVVFPQAARTVDLEPALTWRVEAGQEGPRNLRLSYAAGGLSWDVSYEAVLAGSGTEAPVAARVHLANGTGGRFEEARVRLVSTERGALPFGAAGRDDERSRGRASPALRYSYLEEEPTAEHAAAGAGVVTTYEVPRPVTLEAGETKHIELWSAPAVPVSRFYVYDGVRFDRFQRNRRNDWNYGTEFHEAVETHLSLVNEEGSGLGFDLPPGRFRLYVENEDGTLDLAGEDLVSATAAGEPVHVRLGPARGLRGERERTGYAEITPLHVYEESFEIRLENDTEKDVEIRVVEHLYRWNQFEVVKADTEFTATGPQTIEFRPVLKPGGRRSVHYTVRYRW